MEEKTMRVLSIGAHPDDADTSAGGLLEKLHRKGWEVRLLSITDGSAGTYRVEQSGKPLARRRKREAALSGKLFGGQYDVMDYLDGRLQVTLDAREELIRYIRRFSPDLIITNRLNDYHADHRATAQLVQDASFLLTVPAICANAPYMKHMPVVLYWHDAFQKPYPIKPDVVVPIDDTFDALVNAACCHESQYFDWMYWPDQTEKIDWPRAQQVEDLKARYQRLFSGFRREYDLQVRERFGKNADGIHYVEVYEVSEYGAELTPELRDILER